MKIPEKKEYREIIGYHSIYPLNNFSNQYTLLKTGTD